MCSSDLSQGKRVVSVSIMPCTAKKGEILRPESCTGQWQDVDYSLTTQELLDWMEEAGLKEDFLQDNHSFSARQGTLRGLHYQLNPMCQAKLLRCVRGRVFDVAVDIRKGSPQYAQWVGVELSAENKKQLFIPRGFAHGFITLVDDVEVQYKADNYYSPECDGNVLWNDPEIGVQWPLEPVVLSDKDRQAPLLSQRVARQELNFVYEEIK